MPHVTPIEFHEKMLEIDDKYGQGDIEVGHGYADDLMVEVLKGLGYEKGCEVFTKMHKWYA
jgi:hypothetical protein